MPRILLWIFGIAVCLFLIAPVFVILPLAFSTSEFLIFPPPGYSWQWFVQFFTDASWIGALVRSLQVAAGATLIAVPLGTVAAYGISRGNRMIGNLVRPAFILPIIVPSVVFGAGAYLLVTRLNIAQGLLPLVLVHALLALPFVVLNIGAALTTTDHWLELAARSLGASPLMAYVTTTLKLTAPAIAISALLSFILSLDEVIVALFLSPDTAPTLPVRMYSSIRFELDPLVPVASTVVVAITILSGVLAAAILAWSRKLSRLTMQIKAKEGQ